MDDINTFEQRCAEDPMFISSLLSHPVASLRSKGFEIPEGLALDIENALSLADRVGRSDDAEEVLIAVSAV